MEARARELTLRGSKSATLFYIAYLDGIMVRPRHRLGHGEQSLPSTALQTLYMHLLLVRGSDRSKFAVPNGSYAPQR